MKVHRHLRAIAVLDVVGYSRLMEEDDLSTHLRVNELFASVVAPAVAAENGRIVDRAGDGLLIEFESCVAAVRSALAIQRGLQRVTVGADAARSLAVRIGVNVGDIIVDGDRIVGDGVNVAARLQALAPPGGVCVSDAVRQQLHQDLGAAIVDIGEVELKNIERPIRAYVIDPSAGPSGTGRWRRFLRRSAWPKPGFTAAVIGLGLVIAMAALVKLPAAPATSPPPMSVGVMPFAAADQTIDQSTADTVTAEVSHGLAATPWILVASSSGTQPLLSTIRDVAAVGSDLNVRYLLMGRLRRRDGKIGLDVQLVDASRRVDLWTTHVETGDLGNVPADLALRVNVLLREALYDAETKRLLNSKEAPRTPMEYKMLGDTATDTRFVTLESDRAARVQYLKALKLDASFAPALIAVGYTLLTELDLDPSVDHDAVLSEIDAISKRVIASDSSSAPGWQFRSEALARQWRWDGAIDASDKAIALDGGRAFAFSHRASLLILSGRPREALQWVDKALALPEQRVGYAMLQRCRASMALGDYPDAIRACQTSLSREDRWFQHAYLVAAYALSGAPDDVAAERTALSARYPGITIHRIASIRLSNVQGYLEQADAHLYNGLRKAGIPDR